MWGFFGVPSLLHPRWLFSCLTSAFLLGQVIKAWDIGVATMKKGEICYLLCKPEYAYGSAGSAPKIPSNATLFFEASNADELLWG